MMEAACCRQRRHFKLLPPKPNSGAPPGARVCPCFSLGAGGLRHLPVYCLVSASRTIAVLIADCFIISGWLHRGSCTGFELFELFFFFSASAWLSAPAQLLQRGSRCRFNRHLALGGDVCSHRPLHAADGRWRPRPAPPSPRRPRPRPRPRASAHSCAVCVWPPAASCITRVALLEGEVAPGVVLFHVALEGLLAGQLVAVQVETGQNTELAQLCRDAT
jgi:hypothetical protein